MVLVAVMHVQDRLDLAHADKFCAGHLLIRRGTFARKAALHGSHFIGMIVADEVVRFRFQLEQLIG